MSYILDALRRAEAERGRGSVPGLHAPAVTPPGPPSSSLARALPTKLVVGVAMILALALGLGVWLWPAPGLAPSAPAASASAAAAMAPALSPAPAMPAAVVAPAPELAPTEAVAAPVAAPKTAARDAPVPAPVAGVAKRTKVVIAEPISQPVSMAPLLKDLPEAVRSQIPALVISGAVYSENPAQRLLLVNGQVLSQGSLAAPDVTLEAIHPTTSEFSFRGTRFRLVH